MIFRAFWPTSGLVARFTVPYKFADDGVDSGMNVEFACYTLHYVRVTKPGSWD